MLGSQTWSQVTHSRSYGELGQYEGHWVQDEFTGNEGILDEHEDLFCDDYMAYFKVADRHAVLAAQIASPGTHVTIELIAAVLEDAEEAALPQHQTLQQYLGSRTIADPVEQFTNEENHRWLTVHDFFVGNNGDFATIREVSESSHDIIMGDTISSDASAMDVDSKDATEETEAPQRLSQPLKLWRQTVHPVEVVQHRVRCWGPKLLLVSLQLKTSSLMSLMKLLVRSEVLSTTFQISRTWNRSWLSGFVLLRTTHRICGCLAKMP